MIQPDADGAINGNGASVLKPEETAAQFIKLPDVSIHYFVGQPPGLTSQ